MRKKSYLTTFYYTCAFFLLALACMISFLRVGISCTDKTQQEKILAWLFPESQTSLSAERFHVTWRDFGLDVHAHKLHVETKTTTLARLSLESARVHIHVLRSLMSWKWIFDDVSAHQGEIVLRDTTSSEAEVKPEIHLNALFRDYILPIRYSDIKKIKIGVMFNDQKPAWLWLEHLHIYLSRYKKYILTQINPGAQPNAEHIFMQSVFEDSPNRSQDDVGELFIEAKNVDFTPWFNYIAQDAQVLSSAINMKASFIYNTKHGPSGLLDLGETYFTLGAQHPRQAYGMRQGKVFLQPKSSGWEILGHQIHLFHNGRVFEDWLLHIQKNAQLIEGALGPIRLDLLGSLLDGIEIFHPPSAKALRTLNIDGIAHNTEFSFDLNSKAYQCDGTIQELTTHPWSAIPAVKNARVDYSLSRTGGHLTLQQQDGTLDFGDNFKKPWDIDSLDANVTWRYATPTQKMAVDINRLHLISPKAQLDLHGHLAWLEKQLPHLKVYSELSIQDARDIQNYLPLHAMDANLVGYLSTAFVKGSFNTAQVVWDGPLQEFPYAKHQGIFLAQVPLEKTTFKFASNWEPLEDLQLQLRFDNAALSMVSNQARLGEVQASTITATIPRLGHNSHLTVKANAKGDGQAATAYLLNSPLRDSLEKTLKFLKVEGDIGTEFTLDVPLGNNSADAFVSGVVNFDTNDVILPQDVLTFSDVTGQLKFNSNETHISEMKAQLFGSQVSIVYDGASNPKDNTFHANIDLQGQGTQSLAQHTYLAEQVKISENAHWQLAIGLDIPKDAPYTYQATFFSDLLGIESTLPQPFTKQPDIRTPLSVKIKGNAETFDLSAYYNAWLSGHASVKVKDLKHMQVTSFFVDGGYPNWLQQWHTQPNIQFNFKTLDLGAWSKVISDLNTDTISKNQSITWPEDIKVLGEVNTLTFNEQTLEKVQVDGHMSPTNLELGFDSQRLSGNVKKYTQQNAPIELMLEHVDRQIFDTLERETKQKLSFEKLLTLPWLKLGCTHCELLTGLSTDITLEIKSNPEEKIFEIQNIEIKSDDIDMQGAIKWQKIKDAIQANGVFNATLPNVENVLQKIGYRSPIHETHMNMQGNLGWVSANLMPKTTTLNGQFRVETGKGALIDVDDASAKILSLLDLNSLIRLLKLDFQDVFGKGFFFTKSALSGEVTQGVVTNKDFIMDGSAGKITGEGVLDLVQEQIDYHLSFTPNVTGSGSIPLITAFAVNPLVALPVFAASKLLEPVIDVVTRIDYKVTGPLFQPKLEEVRRGKGQVPLPENVSGEPKE